MTTSNITSIALGGAVIVALLSGCSYTTQRAPGLQLQGLTMQGLCRQDYEILQTVSGTGKVERVFGFRTGPTTYGMKGDSAASVAAYEAMQQAPTADGFLPMTLSVSNYDLGFPLKFFYSRDDATVKLKAVRLKPGTGENCRYPDWRG